MYPVDFYKLLVNTLMGQHVMIGIHNEAIKYTTGIYFKRYLF